jgi:6-phosphogluconate dehydrogenase (decarboxylating)
MQLGMIGLGRMGASLVQRLTKDGHKCVVYDVPPLRRSWEGALRVPHRSTISLRSCQSHARPG